LAGHERERIWENAGRKRDGSLRKPSVRNTLEIIKNKYKTRVVRGTHSTQAAYPVRDVDEIVCSSPNHNEQSLSPGATRHRQNDNPESNLLIPLASFKTSNRDRSIL